MSSLRWVHVLLAAMLMAMIGGPIKAFAFDTVAIPLDNRTLDMTPAADFFTTDEPRFATQSAPDANGIIRNLQVDQPIGPGPLYHFAVFALVNNSDHQIDRLLVAPHFRLSNSGLFTPDLGGTRILAVSASSGFEAIRQPSQEADVYLITLDPGIDHHLHCRTAHRRPATAAAVGSGCLQGRRQQLHAVPRHRPRHRRSAGIAADDRLCRARYGLVPGDGGARLGGAVLPSRRFRLLEPGDESAARPGSVLARGDGGGAGGGAGHLYLHLSPSRPMACTLFARRHRLARRSRRRARYRRGRAIARRGHRPLLLRPDRAAGLRPHRLSRQPRLRPRRHAGADLVPVARLGRHGRPQRHRNHHRRHDRTGPCGRPRARRAPHRLHRNAARLCRRFGGARADQRGRAQGAGAYRRRRHRVGLGRRARPHLDRTRRPTNCSVSSPAH